MRNLGLFFFSFLLLLTACGTSEEVIEKAPATTPASLTVQDVVQQFKKDKLAFSNRRLKPAERGGAPKLDKESVRILVPKLGRNAGGKLYIFEKQADLKKVKEYYDDTSKKSQAFFSHTHVVKNALLTMTGKMKKVDFQKFVSSMDKLQ